MTEKIYWVCDNGLRCFEAPCFSWDIVEMDSQNVTTAFDLDISKPGLSPERVNEVMALLTKGQLQVQGYMVAYEVELSDDLPPSRGVQFVVAQIVGQTSHRRSLIL